MSEPVTSSMDAPGALPRSHVLSYITSTGSPTRVREVASRAIVVLAVVYLLMVAVPVWVLFERFPRYVSLYHDITGPWGAGALTSGYFNSLLKEGIAMVGAIAVGFPCAMVLLFCGSRVRRGRKNACVMAGLALWPLVSVIALGAALVGGWGVLQGFGVWAKAAAPANLVLLAPTLLLVPVIALIHDVISYLRWIARNPLTEKPPAPFIPR